MSIAINLHPKAFRADHGSPPNEGTVWVNVECGNGSYAAIHFRGPADCDELIKAAVEAKRLLLGEDEPRPFPAQALAEAEASPANPYGSAKHGVFGGSAAEVAEGVEPAGQVFACSECTWHSIPGVYPLFGACPRCDECVVRCQCDGPVTHGRVEPTGHLPQHTHGEPGCTYTGCTLHGAAVTR